MSRRLPARNEFNAGLVFQNHLGKARQSPSWASRRAEVLREAAEAILRAGGPSVANLKALGGFTQLLTDAVGLPPATEVNPLGFPLNPAWWVWKALMDEVPSMRFDLQLAMTKVFGE